MRFKTVSPERYQTIRVNDIQQRLNYPLAIHLSELKGLGKEG